MVWLLHTDQENTVATVLYVEEYRQEGTKQENGVTNVKYMSILKVPKENFQNLKI